MIGGSESIDQELVNQLDRGVDPSKLKFNQDLLPEPALIYAVNNGLKNLALRLTNHPSWPSESIKTNAFGYNFIHCLFNTSDDHAWWRNWFFNLLKDRKIVSTQLLYSSTLLRRNVHHFLAFNKNRAFIDDMMRLRTLSGLEEINELVFRPNSIDITPLESALIIDNVNYIAACLNTRLVVKLFDFKTSNQNNLFHIMALHGADECFSYIMQYIEHDTAAQSLCKALIQAKNKDGKRPFELEKRDPITHCYKGNRAIVQKMLDLLNKFDDPTLKWSLPLNATESSLLEDVSHSFTAIQISPRQARTSRSNCSASATPSELPHESSVASNPPPMRLDAYKLHQAANNRPIADVDDQPSDEPGLIAVKKRHIRPHDLNGKRSSLRFSVI